MPAVPDCRGYDLPNKRIWQFLVLAQDFFPSALKGLPFDLAFKVVGNTTLSEDGLEGDRIL